MEKRYSRKNGEPSALKGASSVRRGIHVPVILRDGWPVSTLLLGAMLTSLSYGDAYKAEGSYLTLVVMNFVIAASMLMTPKMVRSISGGGVQTMSSNIGSSALGLVALAHTKMLRPMANLEKTSRSAIGNAGSNLVNRASDFKQNRNAKKGKSQ